MLEMCAYFSHIFFIKMVETAKVWDASAMPKKPIVEIYGVVGSQPTRAVMWACAHKGLPYTLNFTMPGSKREGKGSRSDSFLADLNPNGSVPVLKDVDGFVLYESHAILTYLADRYGWDDLYPRDLRRRAVIDQWLHWHHFGLRQVTLALFADVVRTDLKLATDVLDTARRRARKALRIAEAQLGMHRYLCGSTPSLADISAYCDVGQCREKMCNLLDFEPYPNLSRWLDDMAGLAGHDTVHNARGLQPLYAHVRKIATETGRLKARL